MSKPSRRLLLPLLVATGLVVLSGAGWAAAVRPRPFVVPSASMEPTLRVGDRVVGVRGEVRRGAVVVFRGDGPDGARTFVKRVVGMPGDTVESVDGVLHVNGRAAAEPYLAAGTRTDGVTRQVVPAGHYFVLGDSRDRSADSRHLGPVAEDRVLRVVRWIVFPPGNLGAVA